MGTHPIFESDFDCLTEIEMNNASYAFCQCLITRLAITLLSALSNLLISDHRSVDAFQLEGKAPVYVGDYLVSLLLDGHAKWDSEHFLDVALNGYRDQHSMAFFPFYPGTIRLVSTIMYYPTCWLFSEYHRAVLSGWIVSLFFSSVACSLLYRIILRLTISDIAAHCGAVIFMVNPAGIFFNSCYSESIYIAFFLAAFLLLIDEQPAPWSAAACFAITGAIRSNGLVNIGFIAHFQLHSLATLYYTGAGLDKIVLRLVATCCQCAIIVAPFLTTQYYAYYRYCFDREICLEAGGVDCEERPVWCDNTIPSVYQHIQADWDNGFLAYWQLKKTPLFVMAAPTVWYCIRTLNKTRQDITWRFLWRDLFGLASARAGLPWAGVTMQVCCAVHLVFLLTFGLLFMNVEVITRLVWSSSPLVYIYGFQILQRGFQCPRRIAVVSYCLGYLLLGTVLHSNYFPWT